MTANIPLKITLAAIAVYLTAMAAAFFMTPANQIPITTTTPSLDSVLPSPIIGIAVNLHHTDQLDNHLAAIDQLQQLGFNAIQLLTPAFQENGASHHIQTLNAPGRGPSREQILTFLRYARQKNFHTALMPIVLFTDPRGNEWRGKIQPENWDAWWQSYTGTIQSFADIATEADVDLFCIGSELLSTERQTDRWTRLIAQIRTRYRGRLYYSTNWDHYAAPGFWRQLDFIAINGYWDLTANTNTLHPTDPQLHERWQEIQRQLFAFSRSQGRPILLSEIGYPALPWALKDPWNYIAADDTAADPQTQAKGYQSFLNAWQKQLQNPPHSFGGVFFYEWMPHNHGGPNDHTMNIRNKPAQTTLQHWIDANRPQNTSP